MPPSRTLVAFYSSNFNTTESKPHYINPECYGDDVAEWMRDQLRNRGVSVDARIGQEDFGWYLGFRHGEYKYNFILGYHPDGYWLGWLERQWGLVGSLIGLRKKGIRIEAANTIHDVLASSELVSKIRWHYQKDFDAVREDFGGCDPTVTKL